VEDLHGGKPWVENYKHWNYEAAHRATEVTCLLGINIEFILILNP
jgi:hypothetical protein